MTSIKPCDGLVQGSIYVSVQYKPISKDPMWGSGVLGSSKGKEPEVPDGAVPHVYFPMRKGCRVTMYNDAHQVSLSCMQHSVWSLGGKPADMQDRPETGKHNPLHGFRARPVCLPHSIRPKAHQQMVI